jgi:hypothetical protein
VEAFILQHAKLLWCYVDPGVSTNRNEFIFNSKQSKKNATCLQEDFSVDCLPLEDVGTSLFRNVGNDVP